MRKLGILFTILIYCLYFQIPVNAVESETALTCVEVGFVVENNTRFGIRNRCEQRIYINIYQNDVLVNQEFLDENQWFPVAYEARADLFASKAEFDSGTVTRNITASQDIYCQAVPQGQVVEQCATYVATSHELESQLETDTLQESTTNQLETNQVSSSETSDVSMQMSIVSQRLTQFLESPMLVASTIFIGVGVTLVSIVLLIAKSRKPKSIYIQSGRRRKYRKK
ncbi:MAG: hypothetical protein ACRDAO_01685 [Culicoidibacterales bacterium]